MLSPKSVRLLTLLLPKVQVQPLVVASINKEEAMAGPECQLRSLLVSREPVVAVYPLSGLGVIMVPREPGDILVKLQATQ